jgi:hypothetical protein
LAAPLQPTGIDSQRIVARVRQDILSNYRGAKVFGIPEEGIPAVLARLEWAVRPARAAGRTA